MCKLLSVLAENNENFLVYKTLSQERKHNFPSKVEFPVIRKLSHFEIILSNHNKLPHDEKIFPYEQIFLLQEKLFHVVMLSSFDNVYLRARKYSQSVLGFLCAH